MKKQMAKIKDLELLLELGTEAMDNLPLGAIKKMSNALIEVKEGNSYGFFVGENEESYMVPAEAYDLIEKQYKTLAEIMEDYTPITIAIGTTYNVEYSNPMWTAVVDEKIVLGKVSFTREDAEEIAKNLNGDI